MQNFFFLISTLNIDFELVLMDFSSPQENITAPVTNSAVDKKRAREKLQGANWILKKSEINVLIQINGSSSC